MKRIAIAGFQHETNTFAATKAGFAEFETADAWPGLLKGDALFAGVAGINLPIEGAITAARAAGGCDLVPIIWCAAEPSAHVEDDAYERIASMILDGVRAAGAIDGLYLDLHGAMVTESHDDGEGELLRRLRAAVGPDLPIAVSLDLHANLTRAMVEHASILGVFRTYPHLDMAETGARSFGLLRRMLDGEPLFKAFAQSPFLTPLSAQHTGSAPCDALYGGLADLEGGAVISADIALGFPAADIADAGPAFVAYGATQAAADAACARLLDAFIAAEPRFENPLLSPEEAVAQAMAMGGARPVVIADVQDNPGAGGSSDTTGLLSALVAGGAQGAALALLNDPEIAATAHGLGVGAEFEAALGGKSGQPGQQPFRGRFRVERLSDGAFAFTGAMYAGATAQLGPTALLRVLDPGAQVRIVVGSTRCQCLDQAIFAHIGVEPAAQRILVVKSTVHYRADFEPIAGRILLVEAPGDNLCRLEAAPYRKLREGVRLSPGGRAFKRP